MRSATGSRTCTAFAAAMVAIGMSAAPAWAAPAPWNVGKDHLAIQGYDPVAYFPEGGGAAAKGDAAIAAEHGGVTYRFASAAHRDAFLANPARYEPSYGGWCAWAMLDGDKVDVDPKSFLVQGDRLLLFYKGFLGDTRAKWLKGDRNAEQKTADAMWSKLGGAE